MSQKSLKNKVAVVTGASTGIGRAIAVKLAKNGATVFLLARTEKKLQETKRVATLIRSKFQLINSSCIFSFAEIFIYSLVRQKTSFKQIRAYLLVVLLPFLLSSCSDQGCIEADDFGEYETQTVTVVANASAESCTFDSSKPDVADPSHGSGIKPCLTSGTHSITDETGATQLSTPAGSGCEGFTDVKFRNLCISNCVQQCQAAASSGSTASAEPNWTSTDKKISGRNVGITIRPGAQVIIRTVGSVVLGEAITYPDIYVQANNPMAHSKNSSFGDH